MSARMRACRRIHLLFLRRSPGSVALQTSPQQLWASQTPHATVTSRQAILQLHRVLSTSIPCPKQSEHLPPKPEPYTTYFQGPSPNISIPKPPQPAGSTPPPPPFPSPPEHVPTPPPRSRWGGRLHWAYYALCIGIGTLLGYYQRKVVTLLLPPLPLEPGSPEDLEVLAATQRSVAETEIVQRLLRDPEWTTWPAYAGTPEDQRAHRLTTGPMRGSRGIIFQQVFWNERTGETVTVLAFGRGLCGFPSTVHGGAIATLMDECLGRTAILGFEELTGVTARLEMNYRAPTHPDKLYVIKCSPMATLAETEGNGNGTSGQEDAVVEMNLKGIKSADAVKKRKTWVTGRLETLHGQLCVEAKGLFVVPKGYKLKPLGKI